jgi:hypothetical protein
MTGMEDDAGHAAADGPAEVLAEITERAVDTQAATYTPGERDEGA